MSFGERQIEVDGGALKVEGRSSGIDRNVCTERIGTKREVYLLYLQSRAIQMELNRTAFAQGYIRVDGGNATADGIQHREVLQRCERG